MNDDKDFDLDDFDAMLEDKDLGDAPDSEQPEDDGGCEGGACKI